MEKVISPLPNCSFPIAPLGVVPLCRPVVLLFRSQNHKLFIDMWFFSYALTLSFSFLIKTFSSSKNCLTSSMTTQRVTFVEPHDQNILLSDPSVRPGLTEGILRLSMSEWEKGRTWGCIVLKTPSMVVSEEHRIKGLLLANIPLVLPILISKSSDSYEEDLSPRLVNCSLKEFKRVEVRKKAEKMLKDMHVHFDGEVKIVDETIAPREA
ncbi:hypothetical protein AMTRI_Chr04g184550 [Amborella trichopoda]|uniref:Uncharacterized protein n=1 Tax=Amborella trichopoda TaxID=13333 RepID=W1P506_AMBTC|nr:hypothetical protein AMTR_s00207p00029560 [Amborella trichopoda]